MQNMNQNPAAKLSDEDMINDLLTQEKNIVKGYGTFITEASCANLRQVLTQNLAETAQDQYQVFTQMTNRGWYATENAPAQKVQQAKQKLQQKKTQL